MTQECIDYINSKPVDIIAAICYESFRAWEFSNTQKCENQEWRNAPEWLRDSYRAGVMYIFSNHFEGRITHPFELHAKWVLHRESLGWKLGDKKSFTDKTDPLMIPWEKLGDRQKLKDKLFLSIVRTFI